MVTLTIAPSQQIAMMCRLLRKHTALETIGGGTMRHVLLIATILLSVAAPSLAQEQLKVGNTYSSSINLSSSTNIIYLVLPEGAWVLTSLQDRRDRNQGYPLIDGRLVSTDSQMRVVGVVAFTVGNDANGGWLVPNFCNRKDILFHETPDKQRRGREIRCWGVHSTGMAQPSATAANYVREFYQWVNKNNFKLPQTMILFEIVRASGAKYLHATYYRNPELDGFPRSASSTWHKDVVVGDPKRLSYLESVNTWGKQWLPTFEAAFAGRPK